MHYQSRSVFFGAVLSIALLSSEANAHWCDDMWVSSYNLTIRPEADTVTVPSSGSATMNVYVQNNMGYQLINFKLSAKIGSTSITPTAPTTLKVANTLLPGEKAMWKLPISMSGGGTVKIEDIDFSVSFGNSGQSGRYPTSGAKAAMVVKTDGSLYPAPPLPGLTSSSGDQARSLQYTPLADFDDEASGLDKLLQLYCAGRASWGSTDGVTLSYCKDTASTTCPTSKPSSGTGSKYNYVHLWAAGELAARKSALGDRAAVLRARLQCGVNDGDVGFAGYALFMLGYLGEDAGARTFIESQIAGSGDMAAVAKAAILLMGNAADATKYGADLTAGLKSSSVFVAAASAAALGIVNKDDSAVTGTLVPLVKWTEPDTDDDGKAMFAAHILELVAWDRRGWAPKGADTGAVTFYGSSGAGGGAGGTTGKGGATGSGGATGKGGATGSGGVTSKGGATGSGGAGKGGAIGSGGHIGSGGAIGTGGAVTTSGSTAEMGTGGSDGLGGASGIGGTPEGTAGSTGTGSHSSGCNIAAAPGRMSSLCLLLGLLAVSRILSRRRRNF